MRKFLIVTTGILLAACGANKNSPAGGDSAKIIPDSNAAIKQIQSPYHVVYSSSFTMDDPKNAESVLALWKSYDSGNLASTKNLIADTMEVYPADGSMIKGGRDTITSLVQQQRNAYKTAVSTVNAIMAVKSD